MFWVSLLEKKGRVLVTFGMGRVGFVNIVRTVQRRRVRVIQLRTRHQVMCGLELVWVSSFGWRRQRGCVPLALRNLVKLKSKCHPDTTYSSSTFHKVSEVVCGWHLTWRN